MGRVYAPVRVNGRELWTLFDTGSRNNYIARAAAGGLVVHRLPAPHGVGIGGEHRTLTEICPLLGALVEGKPVDLQAYLLDGIGTSEAGRPIDLLFGALSMQNWGIRVVPDEERLDLSHYPTEFIEY